MFEPTTCVLLRCDGCGELLDEDYVVHFDSEAEALERAKEYDWREVNGKFFCTDSDCVLKAIDAQDGGS